MIAGREPLRSIDSPGELLLTVQWGEAAVIRSAPPLAFWIVLLIQVLFTMTVSIQAPLLGWVLQIAAGISSLVSCLRQPLPRSAKPFLYVLSGTAALGLLQVVSGYTVNSYATSVTALQWMTLLALALLGFQGLSGESAQQRFRTLVTSFAVIIAVVEILQSVSSHGKVLWLFDSGYLDVYGPFASQNNYAQFISLVAPVVLWCLVVDQQRLWLGAFAGALLYSTVLSCASRAGMIIVAGEIITFAWCAYRGGQLGLRQLRIWVGIWLGLALLGGGLLGIDRLTTRLQEEDWRDGRWPILKSTLALIAEHPLLGTGLGTFADVYPAQAHLDTGRKVNHAHNDWAEWTSEAGIPWGLLLLLAGLSAARPAWRYPWAIGLPAICLHGFVDYPFQRFAVAGWATLLAVALRQATATQQRQPLGPVWKVGVWLAMAASVAVLAVFAQAEKLAGAGSEEGVTRASSLVPINTKYWFDRAVLDPDRARQHLARALAASRYNTAARIELALLQETEKDVAAAESNLLEAARRDRTTGPHWALAGFYFRHARPREFSEHAREALRSGSMDPRPLFEWSFLLLHTPDAVLRQVVPDRTDVLEKYLTFLREHGKAPDQAEAAIRLASIHPLNITPLTLAVDDIIAAGRIEDATRVWDAMVASHVIPQARHVSSQINNASFQYPLLQAGFDWRLPPKSSEIFTASWLPGRLQFNFDGRQPDSFTLVEQLLEVEPSRQMQLWMKFDSSGEIDASGLRWTLLPAIPGGQPVEISASRPGVDASLGPWTFRTPSHPGLYRLRLEYTRPPGTRRLEGTFNLLDVSLTPQGVSAR